MFGFRKKPSLDEQLKQLRDDLVFFTRMIGGWPTLIKTSQELQEVTKRWNTTYHQAEALLKQHPESVDVQFILADLLRMGHNIDIQGAAQASVQLLRHIIEATPNHFQAHYCLASLYVSVGPQMAPLAEKFFLKAETLAAPNVRADIYQGLGFACLYQDKILNALEYFEKYLKLQSDSRIQQVVDSIKSGKKPNIIYQDMPDK
jgi:cytochrome c-type biogenesis protein CcmH/NrfG